MLFFLARMWNRNPFIHRYPISILGGNHSMAHPTLKPTLKILHSWTDSRQIQAIAYCKVLLFWACWRLKALAYSINVPLCATLISHYQFLKQTKKTEGWRIHLSDHYDGISNGFKVLKLFLKTVKVLFLLQPKIFKIFCESSCELLERLKILLRSELASSEKQDF